jgi:hypothetical protein
MLRNRQSKTRLGRLRELSYVAFEYLHAAVKIGKKDKIKHLSEKKKRLDTLIVLFKK